jgi:RAB protein geranylgeranyltransferase component A
MSVQVSFHLYARVISLPLPSPKELLLLDEERIVRWLQSLLTWYHETAITLPRYGLGHAIIMYCRFSV